MPLDTGEAFVNGVNIIGLVGKCVTTARALPPEMEDIDVWAKVIETHINDIRDTAKVLKQDIKD